MKESPPPAAEVLCPDCGCADVTKIPARDRELIIAGKNRVFTTNRWECGHCARQFAFRATSASRGDGG